MIRRMKFRNPLILIYYLSLNNHVNIHRIDSASGCPCKNQNNCSEDTAILSGKLPLVDNKVIGISGFTRSLKTQKGILRTNCIDCLDRTNVAQYAYGLAAFGHQLFALGFIGDPTVDLDNTLANDLMKFYEIMGDTLALQYTGSAAHNKVDVILSLV